MGKYVYSVASSGTTVWQNVTPGNYTLALYVQGYNLFSNAVTVPGDTGVTITGSGTGCNASSYWNWTY